MNELVLKFENEIVKENVAMAIMNLKDAGFTTVERVEETLFFTNQVVEPISEKPTFPVPAAGSTVDDTPPEILPADTDPVVDPTAQVIATLEEADKMLEKSQEESEETERKIENAISQLQGDN